jgi:hypothetical protein
MRKTRSSMGAGAAISEGKKARMLTNTRATKKIRIIRNGTIYWRKNVMVISEIGEILKPERAYT